MVQLTPGVDIVHFENHWFRTITKHTLGWEFDQRNLKFMNITYFQPEKRSVENNNKIL